MKCLKAGAAVTSSSDTTAMKVTGRDSYTKTVTDNALSLQANSD